MLLWAGLASVMAVWGVCFRLTFWELSWDVMEPVTYFIGSGTGEAGPDVTCSLLQHIASSLFTIKLLGPDQVPASASNCARQR